MFDQRMIVEPYWHEGRWVYDDVHKGSKGEPLEAPGIELARLLGFSLIDSLAKDIPNAHSGFVLLLSRQPIAGCQVELTYVTDGMDGIAYKVHDRELYWWLGSAFENFFEIPPKTLYARAEPFCSIHGTLEQQALKDRIQELEEWVAGLSKSLRDMQFEARRCRNFSRN